MKNRVDPGRIVYAIEENFKDELSKLIHHQFFWTQ
jgi:hypothetical protein